MLICLMLFAITAAIQNSINDVVCKGGFRKYGGGTFRKYGGGTRLLDLFFYDYLKLELYFIATVEALDF